MARRRKMSRGKSRKLFSRTAGQTHKRNFQLGPHRGGIRL